MFNRTDYLLYDRIIIRALKVKTIIGIYPSERKRKQNVILNIILYTDIKKAADSDDFSKAADYESLADAVEVFIKKSSFMLIETMAEKTAEYIFSEFDRKNIKVYACSVTIDKPGALKKAKSAAVEIFRENSIERT